MIWLLISALCIYSASASLLRTLGPQHWHAATESRTQVPVAADLSGAVFKQLRRLASGVHALSNTLHARAHALGMTPHPHSHGALLRHWHEPGDDSVRLVNSVAMDPELADLKASAAMGGATLLLALGPDNAWQLPAAVRGAWPVTLATPWRNAELAPSAEPPIG